MIGKAALFAGVLICSGNAEAMSLTSPDIRDRAPLKTELAYPRCGGRNVAPALSWSGVPTGALSLALTMIDTSVKPAGWSHWVVVNLPPGSTSLAGNGSALPSGATALISDFGDAHYDGPCPPKGSGVHRYEFTLWALAVAKVPISDGSAKIQDWLRAHAIAHAQISGTFGS